PESSRGGRFSPCVTGACAAARVYGIPHTRGASAHLEDHLPPDRGPSGSGQPNCIRRRTRYSCRRSHPCAQRLPIRDPMPELPEVETTRRGLEPHVLRRRIVTLTVHEPRLRWRVPDDLPAKLAGQRITGTARRAKYLLIGLESGTLLVHLGMSGSLRILPADTPRTTHDHYDLLLESGRTLRFNDPRRFCSLHYTSGDPGEHPL